MITVRLKGGLGNQMFQYAFGRALAARRGDGLALDLTYLLDRRPRSGIVPREYGLDLFPVRARLTRLSRVARRVGVPYLWLGLAEARRRAAPARTLRDTSLSALDDAPREGDVFLDGYWQDERFFEGVRDEVARTFRPPRAFPPATLALLGDIQKSASVCVNVRRADFVHHPGSARAHGFVGGEYYARAMRLVEERAESGLRVFVFSDDLAWCETNLRFAHPTAFVGHEHAGDRFSHYLALMAACRHFVIPNSSFGWWAAWLAEHEEPSTLVVAPARWFAALDAPSRDPAPARWLRA